MLGDQPLSQRHSLVFCGVCPTPEASLLQGLGILPSPLGQVTHPSSINVGRRLNRSERALAASTRLRTTSDNAASGGQGGGAVGVNTLQRPGYSPGWRTLLATTTFLSQRAEPSPLWLESFPKRLIRRGTTRISRVICDKARRGCAPPVSPSRGAAARCIGGGDGGGSDPRILAADAPRGRGRLFRPLFILFPCLLGSLPPP